MSMESYLILTSEMSVNPLALKGISYVMLSCLTVHIARSQINTTPTNEVDRLHTHPVSVQIRAYITPGMRAECMMVVK